MQHRVPLGEGSTFYILTRHPNVMALHAECPKRQSLCSSHVNALTLVHRLLSVGQNTLQVTVDMEPLRCTANFFTDQREFLSRYSGWQMRQDLCGKLLWR